MNRLQIRHIADGDLAWFYAAGAPVKGDWIEVPQKKWTDSRGHTYEVTRVIWDASQEGHVTVLVDDPKD
jgi:hypothetical protein